MDRIKQLYQLATRIQVCKVKDLGGEHYQASGVKGDLPASFCSVSSFQMSDLFWRDSFSHDQLLQALGREMETKAAAGELTDLASA